MLHLTRDDRNYWSWDELRRRNPPEAMSSEEWWAITRLRRLSASTVLPITDTRSNPFRFVEPPSLRMLLRYVDANAAGTLSTDAEAMTPDAGRTHLGRALAEEPFSSSLLEGAATTREKAKQMIFENRRPATRDELMVLNNYFGLDYVKQKTNENLTVEMILELHRIITQGTLDDPKSAGQLRTDDEVRVVDDTTDEILHQPPPHTELRQRLEALCAFANQSDEDEPYCHPIVRAIALHFFLAYEHPFVDGNGRTARALFYWSALRSKYWLIEYVSISSVIAEARIRYGRAFLDTETDSGDLTYFLLHQADVLRRAIERLQAYAARRKREIENIAEQLGNLRGKKVFNLRQQTLVNDAVRGRLATTTIAEHQHRHGVSYLTARSDLEALVRHRLFRKRSEGRMSRYRAHPEIKRRLDDMTR
jgi:Fic family protein